MRRIYATTRHNVPRCIITCLCDTPTSSRSTRVAIAPERTVFIPSHTVTCRHTPFHTERTAWRIVPLHVVTYRYTPSHTVTHRSIPRGPRGAS